jgi:UDP-glucose 4-epimerase
MRLFITGGTGFIGSYLLLEAMAAGHDVRALRRTPTSSTAIPLPREPVWIEGDLDSLTTSPLEGVDAVIHLASAGVSPQHASWNELVKTNVVGSLRLLQFAVSCGVRRVVVAGTCHEYGNAALRYEAIPPDAPLEPISSYGASKAAAFQLIRAFAIEHRLELFYGRIFAAFGEGQFANNFWPSLRRAALSGEDLPMTSGQQVNDFIPATKVAIHLLNGCSRTDIASGVPLVVNIGSGISMSLLSFAEKEWKRLKATGTILPNKLPSRPNQIERYVPDLRGLEIMNTSQPDIIT